jgi:uncharacterized protein YuzE
MKLKDVSLEYDAQVDAAYLTLAEGTIAGSAEVQPGLIVDLDEQNRPLGVEILRFSRRFIPKTRGSRPAKPRRKVSRAGA